MQGLGSGPISLAGTDAQKDRWLPPVRQGRSIAAFALSEPDAGSDVAALATPAVPDGDDHVRIDREKSWLPNGGIAGPYVGVARTRSVAGATGPLSFRAAAGPAGLVERKGRVGGKE